MVKTLAVRKPASKVNDQPGHSAPTEAKRGRPPQPPTKGSVTVSLTLLRNCHAAMVNASAKLRPCVEQRDLTLMINGLADRLGPALNQDYKPSDKPARTNYELTLPDGVKILYTNLNDAAAAWGVPKKSLTVMLARGKGQCSRKALHAGMVSRKWLRRVPQK